MLGSFYFFCYVGYEESKYTLKIFYKNNFPCKCYSTGATGATGVTGAAGTTGATGLGLSAFAYIYSTTAQSVADNAAVVFNSPSTAAPIAYTTGDRKSVV